MDRRLINLGEDSDRVAGSEMEFCDVKSVLVERMDAVDTLRARRGATDGEVSMLPVLGPSSVDVLELRASISTPSSAALAASATSMSCSVLPSGSPRTSWT